MYHARSTLLIRGVLSLSMPSLAATYGICRQITDEIFPTYCRLLSGALYTHQVHGGRVGNLHPHSHFTLKHRTLFQHVGSNEAKRKFSQKSLDWLQGRRLCRLQPGRQQQRRPRRGGAFQRAPEQRAKYRAGGVRRRGFARRSQVRLQQARGSGREKSVAVAVLVFRRPGETVRYALRSRT